MVELFKTSSLSLVNDLLNMVAKPGNKLYFFPTFSPFKFHKHVPYHVCSDYNGIIFPDLLGSTNAYRMSFTAHIIVGNLKKNKKKEKKRKVHWQAFFHPMHSLLVFPSQVFLPKNANLLDRKNLHLALFHKC